jgi:hypothetical protein
MKWHILIFLSFFSYSCGYEGTLGWTWTHRKHFTERQRSENKQKKEIVYTKEGVEPFTQLVFSWNALRPLHGHFSFSVRVRNAKTKKWSKWHSMADWGHGTQKSYLTRADSFTQFFHVRLQTIGSSQADAFSIKIMAHSRADLSLVHAITVCLSDYTKFRSEVAHNFYGSLSTVKIKGIPIKSQLDAQHARKEEICSPTSCSMVTSFLTGKEVDSAQFAQSAYDASLDQYGSWPFNMAHAFDMCKGSHNFAVMRLNSFVGLHDRLVEGMPVIVSVRGSLTGAPKVYENGHLLVVCGFDAIKKRVLCLDPAVIEKKVSAYDLTDFLRAWERSHRLCYVVERS